MPNWLKQSTAVDIGIGPFLDSTDGNTPETALTITAPDIRLKKNGGAFAQKNAAQTLTHEEAGWYEVSLDATDTNTLGILIIAIHESGALPVWKEYMVLPANVYDSLVAGSDFLDANVAQWNGTTIPAVHTAGYPIVTIKDGTGTGEIDTSSGKVLLANGVHGGAAATLTLKQAEINNSVAGSALILTSVDSFGLEINSAGADAVRITSTGGNGDAIELVPHGTGVGIRGSITGALVGNITGNLSGSVGSVTGAVGSVTGLTVATVHSDLNDIQARLPAALGANGNIKADIRDYNGIVGTFSGGRPEVRLGNVGHGGAASTLTLKTMEINNSVAGAALILGTVDAECIQIVAASGDAVSITSNGGNGDAIQLNPHGTGVGIRGSITGALVGNITGSLSGSVGSATSLGTSSIAASSFAPGAIDAAAIAANAIGASELAADAVAEIVSAIGGVGAFAITVTVNDGAAALQNVAVSIWDGGGALSGRGTTDASGNASFSLAAGTYTVALVKANYSFAPVSRTVTGNQAGSIVTTLSMSIIAPIVASGNPAICVVAGYIKDLNGNALVGSLVKARLVPAVANRPITSDSNVLGLEADEAVTDALGYVSFELIRTDEIDQPCSYTFKCQDAQMEKRNVLLAAATLDIATL